LFVTNGLIQNDDQMRDLAVHMFMRRPGWMYQFQTLKCFLRLLKLEAYERGMCLEFHTSVSGIIMPQYVL